MRKEGKKIIQITLETGIERHSISRYTKTYENKMKTNSQESDQAKQKREELPTNVEFNQEDKLRKEALSILCNSGLDIDTLCLSET